MTQIDIVLPTYNPYQGWEEEAISHLSALSAALPEITLRVFIVPDGSKTGHSSDVRSRWSSSQWPVFYCDYSANQGKGYAVRYGVQQTDAPFVIYTDYDFPFTLDSYKQVIKSLLDGADVVIAHRESASYGRRIRFKREILSEISHFVNTFLSLPTTDTQGGLKGFSQVGKSIFLRTEIKRFLFDTEFICLARRKKVRIDVVHGAIRPNIILSAMKAKTIFREIYSLPRLIRARWFS